MKTSGKRAYKINEFIAHDFPIRSIALGHKSGRVLATAGDDTKVNLWAIGQPQCIISLPGHESPVGALRFGHADELILTGTDKGVVNIWDLEPIQVIRTFDNHSSISSVDLSPTGTYIACGTSCGQIKLWDTRTSQFISEISHHTKRITCLRFSPDNKWLASASEDCSIKLWDITASKLICEFSKHSGPVSRVEFHPHMALLTSCSLDRTIKFWDLNTYSMISTTAPEKMHYDSIFMDPKGTCLYASNAFGLKILTWDPIQCLDQVQVDWRNISDIALAQQQLIAASYLGRKVSVFNVDLKLCKIDPTLNPEYHPIISSHSTYQTNLRRNRSIKISAANNDAPITVSEVNSDSTIRTRKILAYRRSMSHLQVLMHNSNATSNLNLANINQSDLQLKAGFSSPLIPVTGSAKPHDTSLCDSNKSKKSTFSSQERLPVTVPTSCHNCETISPICPNDQLPSLKALVSTAITHPRLTVNPTKGIKTKLSKPLHNISVANHKLTGLAHKNKVLRGKVSSNHRRELSKIKNFGNSNPVTTPSPIPPSTTNFNTIGANQPQKVNQLITTSKDLIKSEENLLLKLADSKDPLTCETIFQPRRSMARTPPPSPLPRSTNAQHRLSSTTFSSEHQDVPDVPMGNVTAGTLFPAQLITGNNTFTTTTTTTTSFPTHTNPYTMASCTVSPFPAKFGDFNNFITTTTKPVVMIRPSKSHQQQPSHSPLRSINIVTAPLPHYHPDQQQQQRRHINARSLYFDPGDDINNFPHHLYQPPYQNSDSVDSQSSTSPSPRHEVLQPFEHPYELDANLSVTANPPYIAQFHLQPNTIDSRFQDPSYPPTQRPFPKYPNIANGFNDQTRPINKRSRIYPYATDSYNVVTGVTGKKVSYVKGPRPNSFHDTLVGDGKEEKDLNSMDTFSRSSYYGEHGKIKMGHFIDDDKMGRISAYPYRTVPDEKNVDPSLTTYFEKISLGTNDKYEKKYQKGPRINSAHRHLFYETIDHLEISSNHGSNNVGSHQELGNHGEVCSLLQHRLKHLKLAHSLLRSNTDTKMVVETINDMTDDDGAFMDVLTAFIKYPQVWTLDICMILLPRLQALIDDKHENYITIGCKAIKIILKNFGQLIKSSLVITPGIGVDINREERYKKCRACIKQLYSIKSYFNKSVLFGGKLGQEMKEVQILLEALE